MNTGPIHSIASSMASQNLVTRSTDRERTSTDGAQTDATQRVTSRGGDSEVLENQESSDREGNGQQLLEHPNSQQPQEEAAEKTSEANSAGTPDPTRNRGTRLDLSG